LADKIYNNLDELIVTSCTIGIVIMILSIFYPGTSLFILVGTALIQIFLLCSAVYRKSKFFGFLTNKENGVGNEEEAP